MNVSVTLASDGLATLHAPPQAGSDSLSNKQSLIDALTNGTMNRGQVLRAIVESQVVADHFFNRAFVAMQYFGYLRRDPDASYLNWIQELNTTGNSRNMINGFVNSLEYRFRFGP